MTTQPAILNEQDIREALRPLYQSDEAFEMAMPMEMAAARLIESAAVGKLAEGVELEGFRLTWHSDQARYTVSKPNIDSMDVVPLSTAQAAVAAEKLKTEKARALHKQACEAYDRKNRSGCCCTISDGGEGDEVVKPCAMHQVWRDEAVAAERVKAQQTISALCRQIAAHAASIHRAELGIHMANETPSLAPSPAPAAEPVNHAELLAALMLGLDLKPSTASLGPGALRPIGQAIAAQAKSAVGLPAAAGVEERAGLVLECIAAANEQSAAMAALMLVQEGDKEGNVQLLERSRKAIEATRSAIDRLASTAALVPEAAAPEWDANPEGVVEGEESGARTDASTGIWQEPDVPNSPCLECDGEGRVPSAEECTRCGHRGCWTVECKTCGGTGETAAAPAAGGGHD